MIAEGGEFPDPVGLDLIEPVAEILERLVPEVIDADAGIFSNALFADEATTAEDTQVAAHGLGGLTERGGDVAGTEGPLAEQVDDGLAGLVAEGFEGLVHGLHD